MKATSATANVSTSIARHCQLLPKFFLLPSEDVDEGLRGSRNWGWQKSRWHGSASGKKKTHWLIDIRQVLITGSTVNLVDTACDFGVTVVRQVLYVGRNWLQSAGWITISFGSHSSSVGRSQSMRSGTCADLTIATHCCLASLTVSYGTYTVPRPIS